MLNDYRPTHDPNQDTFKVEYLVGGAAVMGILFPYKYTISEVCDSSLLEPTIAFGNGPDWSADVVGFLYLA